MASRGTNVKRRILLVMSVLVVLAGMAIPAMASASTFGAGRSAIGGSTVQQTARSAVVASSAPKPCDDTGGIVKAKVTAGPLHVKATIAWDKKPDRLTFGFSAAPSFGLNVEFGGQAQCSVTEGSLIIPLPDALELKLTPELTFAATAAVGADFTWNSALTTGFTVTNGGFREGRTAYTSATRFKFTGTGSLSMSIDLKVAIETKGGKLGVEGTVGPELTAKVSSDGAAPCWSLTREAAAQFDAFAKVLGFKAQLDSPKWRWAEAALDTCSSTPCFPAGNPASCTSISPNVALSFHSEGDTSACTFQLVTNWGDKSPKETTTFNGGPNGALVVTLKHSYKKEGTYLITVDGTLITNPNGECSVFSSATWNFAFIPKS
jgi:hypothetical protein